MKLSRATVDLQTPRPFDFKKDRLRPLRRRTHYYENRRYTVRDSQGLMSQTWFDNKLGGAISLAYNDRKSQINAPAQLTDSVRSRRWPRDCNGARAEVVPPGEKP